LRGGSNRLFLFLPAVAFGFWIPFLQVGPVEKTRHARLNEEENMTRRMLLLVAFISCWAATVVPASAQHLKQIPGSLAQVAAGRSEVWGLDAANQVYRFNSGTTTFAKIGTIRLTHVAVGGGTVLQADQVWGVTASGKVYRFSYKTNTFAQVPGTLAQIVVSEGYQDTCHPYEVWGLDTAQLIYRYDYCTSQFVTIPGFLTHIAVGGGDIWGSMALLRFTVTSFIKRRVPASWKRVPSTDHSRRE